MKVVILLGADSTARLNRHGFSGHSRAAENASFHTRPASSGGSDTIGGATAAVASTTGSGWDGGGETGGSLSYEYGTRPTGITYQVRVDGVTYATKFGN